jgi:uncharacterized protein YcbK (DUF882 family)
MDRSTARQGNARTTRRRFLTTAIGAATFVGLTGNAAAVRAALTERRLAFHNLHTGENLALPYRRNGRYLNDALVEINHILRDFRTDEVCPIDVDLLDLLHRLRTEVGSKAPFEVISGYRSPKTNAKLAAKSNGVAKKSLHMRGMAIDVRLPGCDLRHLRDAAKSLRLGGVGYYAKSGFIHVDVGRVRYW